MIYYKNQLIQMVKNKIFCFQWIDHLVFKTKVKAKVEIKMTQIILVHIFFKIKVCLHINIMKIINFFIIIV